MSEKNKHTELLFPFLLEAPRKIQRKFYNFHGKESLNKFVDPYGDSCFMGIMFIKNRVYCYNIEIYSIKDDSARYLDITKIFNQFLKEYNIFHLCYLFHRALFKYYRENSLTEKILPYVKHQNDKTLKPKFTYAVTKHRGRYRLFIESKRNENQRKWNSLLFRAIRKDSYSSELRRRIGEGFDLFGSPYKSLPKLNTCTYEYDDTKDLRKSIKKRRKEVRTNIQSRRLLRRSNRNIKIN